MNTDIALDLVDEERIVSLTRELIAINTVNPPGNETVLAEFLRDHLAAFGLESELPPIAEGRANLLCRVKGNGAVPALVLCGHMDTVPAGNETWTHDPFAGAVADGCVYGRGSTDMKGALAAMVAAAVAVHRSKIPLRGDLVLAFTASEETDSQGARHLIDRHYLDDAGAFIIGEPTNLDVYLCEKGGMWIEVTMFGRAAHGSTPHLGKNAVVAMASAVADLHNLVPPHTRHPYLGSATVNVGAIRGGAKPNIVPDRCVVTLDLRTVPGQDPEETRAAVAEPVRRAAERHGVRWSVDIIGERPPVDTDPADPLVGRFLQAAEAELGQPATVGGAAYCTDASVLIPALKTPMILFGPGNADLAHQVNERVEIRRLITAARVYARAAAMILG